jgi:hypothetical protein
VSPYRPAETLLKELGITEPHEIDVEAIAYHCGAVVHYRPLGGCSARIIGRGDTAIISVEKNSPRGRQRFSVGHELGHWMRDRGKAIFLCQKTDLRSPWDYRRDPESLANEYAANLLMPDFMFKPAARGREMTLHTAGELAELFQTSRTATAIRLVQLGSYPAIVVCYDMKRRLWYSRGPDVPYFLRPHQELSPNTEAFDLLFGKTSHSRPMRVDAADWIDHSSSERYDICEHSVKIGDDMVFAMLWWKDESQIVDLGDA